MSIHVCKCAHKGREEFHLRYPGMRQSEAQALADKINGGALYPQPLTRPASEITEQVIRDVCELEPANPDLNDTLCVDVSDLKIIVDRALSDVPLTRPAVPEGWKLVPVEPTEDMLDAAHESDREYTLRNFGDVMTVMQGPWDHWDAMVNAAPQPDQVTPFQNRVQPWLMECFGEMIAGDREERNHRFLEEALELVQACGCTASEAHQLVDYTFGRPIGEPAQEVGGVMVTLAALCLANGLDMHANGETELMRITAPEMVKKIRAKQAAKPKYSPLPEAAPQPD